MWPIKNWKSGAGIINVDLFQSIVNVNDIVQDTVKFWQYESNNLLTGIKKLDNIIGGLGNGDLVIIAGRPGMGKSSLMAQMSLKISQSKPVVIFTLEMSSKLYLTRMFINLLKKDLREIKKDFNKPNFIKDLEENFNNRTIILDDSSFLTISQLEEKLGYIFDLYPLGCVMIDYVQLMTANRNESRQQEISDISRKLKGLARQYQIPFVIGSQLNRSAKQRSSETPRLDDLRESGALEQDADKVLMLHRSNYVDYRLDESEEPDEVSIIIAKNRNGPIGTIQLGWIGKWMLFIDKEF